MRLRINSTVPEGMASHGFRPQPKFETKTIDEPKPNCLNCFGLFAKRSSSKATIEAGKGTHPNITEQSTRLPVGEQNNGFAKQVNGEHKNEPIQAARHENSSNYKPAGHSTQDKQKFSNGSPADKNLQQPPSLAGPSEVIRQRENKKNGESMDQQPGLPFSNKEKNDVNTKSTVPKIVSRQESFNKDDKYKETNAHSKSSAENKFFRQTSCCDRDDHKYTNTTDPPKTTMAHVAQTVVRHPSFKTDDKHTDVHCSSQH